MKAQKRSKKTDSKSKLNTSTGSKINKKRLWLYRLICAFLIPLLFLGLLEGGLRLFGYGYPTEAVIKYKLDEKEGYVHNYQFGWRFFPRRMARTFDGFVFDTKKSPDTYRIFVIGASAAMGMPAPSYNFGRILEAMLNDMYPQMSFEVYTVAMVAINSHAVLEIAKDCAKYEPDLFVVYLGNNEVVGPFGPGTVLSPGAPSLAMIRANLALKTTRTGQFMEQALGSLSSHSETPHRWGGLEMFMEKQVRHDSPDMEYVYHHFQKNLQDICRTARRAGADVIVSNVACNLKDSPPFASQHRLDMTEDQIQQWLQLYQAGADFENNQEYPQAIESYLQAAQIDASFADLQFRTGRCYWHLGAYEKAKESYSKAREYDTLRFRADTRINEIIRNVASGSQQQGVCFVDSIAALEAHSPHSIPGEELFYEHVHFNFKGNYLLASAIFPTIQTHLPTELKAQTSPVLSEVQVAERLAYTDFERHDFLNSIYREMLNEPPFTNQLYHEEMLTAADRQLQLLQESMQDNNLKTYAAVYDNAIRLNPDDWHLAWQYALFLGSGLHDTAAQEVQLRKVIQLCPHEGAYIKLAKNLHQQGKVKEAQELLHQALQINPNAGKAHVELALIYQQLRNTEKYIEHLSKSLDFDPTGSLEAWAALAEAYDKTGRPREAIKTLYRALAYFPEDQTAPVHASLAYLLNAQGDYKEALQELELALKIKPDFADDELFNTLMNHLNDKVKQ